MSQAPIKISTDGGVTTVAFTERSIIDEVMIQQIGEALLKLVDSQPGLKMVLSFEGVDHMSSAALGVLITVNGRVKARNGQLRLCNIAKPIFEIFKITKLDKLFQTLGTEEQAVKSLA
jgi:anti-sigma B factor antagonist